MKHLSIFCIMVAVNVVLVSLSPGTAITSSDPIILVFAIYGISHVETLMIVASWRLNQYSLGLSEKLRKD